MLKNALLRENEISYRILVTLSIPKIQKPKMEHFIRTVTINGKPLVLRFNKTSDVEFEVFCLNDNKIDKIIIGSEDLQWKIKSGGSEEILIHSERVISLIDN